jgi:hypothetical protein
MSTDAATVRKISDDTLVKVTSNFGSSAHRLEANSFELIRMRTTIPIPRIRRTFKDGSGRAFDVVDYIPGERLDRTWPSLPLWSKLRVALILRRYIRQLRQINSSVPGPVADTSQTCDGWMFRDFTRGPFPDYDSLSAFYNGRLDIIKQRRASQGNTIRRPLDTDPFDDSRPLVFTHHGLSMRNIIFGRDGRIWLVDWGRSGFYPWWFEYVSTVYAAENDMAPDSWNRLIPFIADPLFKHMKWIDQIGIALIAYR